MSAAILKTSDASSSFSSGLRETFSPLLRSVASVAGRSSGEGRYHATASRSGCTPLSLSDVPQSTGTIWLETTRRRIAPFNSSAVRSPFSRYASITPSSRSATFSHSSARASSASSFSSAGTSPTVNFAPSDASSNVTDFISIRSMTPVKDSSLPMGSSIGTAFACSLSRISCTTRPKSAPMRSILFTNARRGTR